VVLSLLGDNFVYAQGQSGTGIASTMLIGF